MPGYRKETDSMGEVNVPKEALYGAQTQRSLIHFSIGDDHMPKAVIHNYIILKRACAESNAILGKLPQDKKNMIIEACDELLKGAHSEAFPLYVYQTGSGTQTNMNVNEVIANLANLKAKMPLGSKSPIHPNDHVNMSQSSNDSFPTVMHMSAASLIVENLIPALMGFLEALKEKENEFSHIIKIGRTHLMDAVPLTLGQEFSGYVAQIDDDLKRLSDAVKELYELPIGGSAIGTGLNTHKDFSKTTCEILKRLCHLPFTPAKNKFSQIAAHDRLVFVSSVLKTLGCSLMKIAHDLAWMGSGPRCGLGELILPENEPGSSIMPGKVNPTQCEAICMIAAQLHGYDSAIAIGGSLGNFELNVYKPLIIFNLCKMINLLTDGLKHFTEFFIVPLKANEKRIRDLVENSLMLVTALSPAIGYDKAAKLAHYAYEHGLSLKDAAVKLHIMGPDEFERLVDVSKMTHP